MLFSEVDPTTEFGEAILPLASEWAEECGVDLVIQWECYEGMRKHKLLRSFVAYDSSGEIVGFALFFIGSPFRENSKCRAQLDALYIDPASRKGLVGLKFLKFCEDRLTPDVTEIIWSVLPDFDYSVLLRRMGYEPVDVLYRKEV